MIIVFPIRRADQQDRHGGMSEKSDIEFES